MRNILSIGEKHSMRAKYTSSCNCFDPFCSVKYKALICCKNEFKSLRKQQVIFYRKDRCLDPTNQIEKFLDRGISLVVKPYIDRMMKEDTEITPKQCHSMLINANKISLSLMPKLYQVIFC